MSMWCILLFNDRLLLVFGLIIGVFSTCASLSFITCFHAIPYLHGIRGGIECGMQRVK